VSNDGAEVSCIIIDEQLHQTAIMGAKPTKLATTEIVPSQWAYLLVMNGVGAAFLNTAINATLAYVLNMNAESLSVWSFDPTPIAGDFAVTIFIQQVCYSYVVAALCHLS
jgi:hypothetical protein